jgi:hypothetical protein
MGWIQGSTSLVVTLLLGGSMFSWLDPLCLIVTVLLDGPFFFCWVDT